MSCWSRPVAFAASRSSTPRTSWQYFVWKFGVRTPRRRKRLMVCRISTQLRGLQTLASNEYAMARSRAAHRTDSNVAERPALWVRSAAVSLKESRSLQPSIPLTFIGRAISCSTTSTLPSRSIRMSMSMSWPQRNFVEVILALGSSSVRFAATAVPWHSSFGLATWPRISCSRPPNFAISQSRSRIWLRRQANSSGHQSACSSSTARAGSNLSRSRQTTHHYRSMSRASTTFLTSIEDADFAADSLRCLPKAERRVCRSAKARRPCHGHDRLGNLRRRPSAGSRFSSPQGRERKSDRGFRDRKAGRGTQTTSQPDCRDKEVVS